MSTENQTVQGVLPSSGSVFDEEQKTKTGVGSKRANSLTGQADASTTTPTQTKSRGKGGKRGATQNAITSETTNTNTITSSSNATANSNAGTPKSAQTGTSAKDNTTAEPAAKKPRRRKVDHACVYCRRSHMTCDEGRPCSRCIRRNIGHLCRDEPKKKVKSEEQQSPPSGGTATTATSEWNSGSQNFEPTPTSAHQPTALVLTSQNQSGIYGRGNSSLVFQELIDPRKENEKTGPDPSSQMHPTHPVANNNLDSKINGKTENGINLVSNRTTFNDWGALGAQSILAQTSDLFFSEHANSEFASLGDFLSMIEDPSSNPELILQQGLPSGLSSVGPMSATVSPGMSRKDSGTDLQKQGDIASFDPNNVNAVLPGGPRYNQVPGQSRVEPVISDSARDKFFLTAADPSVDVSPEERLKQVIRAKVEAGLLQPFNYARGYARLQKYMDNYMNQSSKQRILKPLSVFRPAFRAIAQSLMDIDLVLVEEAFERMLLDYDRVFTSMAIPACLWRRTGEIYRGNKEFAGLVEVSVDDLRDGKLAIYELMSEESAVNYWEKYGNIAFDSGQKAVLTSCNLRTRDRRKRRACCFSFTIQRDRYNM